MREVAKVHRNALLAGLTILLLAPIGAAAASDSPISTYLAMLVGGFLIASIIIVPVFYLRQRRDKIS